MLNVGDTVRLKSGGPLMTVEWVSDGGKSTKCCWFDEEARHHSHGFVAAALQVSPERDAAAPDDRDD